MTLLEVPPHRPGKHTAPLECSHQVITSRFPWLLRALDFPAAFQRLNFETVRFLKKFVSGRTADFQTDTLIAPSQCTFDETSA
jgi:hypothetical protein